MPKGGTLKVRVVGDANNFRKTLDRAQGKVASFGKKFGAAAKKVAKVGAMAFAAAGAAAIGGAFKVAAFGDEVAKTSQKAGLGVEQFQELRFAFGQGGVAAKTFDTAVQKFNKRLGESATTGGTADDAFEALNITLKDADGNVRDASGALDEALPKLAAIESDAERAAIAGDLFGQRAGPELAAALSDGVEGIDAARKKAQELGIVMDEDAAEAAEKFTDQWDDIKQSALGLMRKGLTPVMGMLSDKVFPFIQSKLIPALSDFRDWIGPKLKRAASEISKFFKGTVLPAIGALAGWWKSNGPAIIATAQRVFEGIKQAINVVIGVVRDVIGWFQTMGSDTSSSQAGMLADLKQIWDQLFATIKGAIDAIVAIVGHGIKIIRAFWDRFGKHIVSFLTETWDNVMQVIRGALDVIMGVFEVFAGIFTGDWTRAWEGIKQIVSGVWDIIKGVIKQALNIIKTVLGAALAVISQAWEAVWNTIKTVARNVWDAIVGRVSDKVDEIRSAISTAMAVISSVWESTWEGVKSFFSGIWDGIISRARSAVNTVIGFVNSIIRGWNSLEFSLPAQTINLGPLGGEKTIGGQSIGTPNIDTIPRLAEGGLAKERTLAMLGEGGHDEAVLPLTDQTFRKLADEIGRARQRGGDGAAAGTKIEQVYITVQGGPADRDTAMRIREEIRRLETEQS